MFFFRKFNLFRKFDVFLENSICLENSMFFSRKFNLFRKFDVFFFENLFCLENSMFFLENSICLENSIFFSKIHFAQKIRCFFGTNKKKSIKAHLSASLLVSILMLNAMHLQAVRLQRAPLRKRLLAQIALVRAHPGMSPSVSLQIESVIESLAAESAQIAFDVRVTFHVTVQEPLQ
jgi:hypothetical protein